MFKEKNRESYIEALTFQLENLPMKFNRPDVMTMCADFIADQFVEAKDVDQFIHDCLYYKLITDNGDGMYINNCAKLNIF